MRQRKIRPEYNKGDLVRGWFFDSVYQKKIQNKTYFIGMIVDFTYSSSRRIYYYKILIGSEVLSTPYIKISEVISHAID